MNNGELTIEQAEKIVNIKGNRRGMKTKLLWQDKNYRDTMIQKHKTGKRQTIEYRQSQSKKIKQVFENPELKKQRSLNQKQLWQNPEYRKHMSEVHSGEKSHCWQGGKSFEPYPLGWTKTFKEQIRYRDKYVCQFCGLPEIECFSKLHVHHIDYDKFNLNPDNLITLCHGCHSKTSVHKRREWEVYIKMGEYKKLSEEMAEFILSEILVKLDEGNETIMTDSFTRFAGLFPEHRNIVEKIFLRETARPFRTDEERVSKRGY